MQVLSMAYLSNMYKIELKSTRYKEETVHKIKLHMFRYYPVPLRIFLLPFLRSRRAIR